MSELALWAISIMIAIFAPVILSLIILSIIVIYDLCKQYFYFKIYLIVAVLIAVFIYFTFKYFILDI